MVGSQSLLLVSWYIVTNMNWYKNKYIENFEYLLKIFEGTETGSLIQKHPV